MILNLNEPALLKAVDDMHWNLKRFRLERTVANYKKVLEAAQKITALNFHPVIIKRGGIQAYDNTLTPIVEFASTETQEVDPCKTSS